MTPLRQRMSEDMQVRNLAPHTQRSYLQQVSQFARHFGTSPELLGPDDIRAYQLHLTRDKRLSASSILVAVAAIRFVYKVTLRRDWNFEDVIPSCRKPQTLPVVMSPDEVSRFLGAVGCQRRLNSDSPANMVLVGLSLGMEDASAKKGEPSPAIHGALDHLEPADLAFDGARGPRQVERCLNSADVLA